MTPSRAFGSSVRLLLVLAAIASHASGAAAHAAQRSRPLCSLELIRSASSAASPFEIEARLRTTQGLESEAVVRHEPPDRTHMVTTVWEARGEDSREAFFLGNVIYLGLPSGKFLAIDRSQPFSFPDFPTLRPAPPATDPDEASSGGTPLEDFGIEIDDEPEWIDLDGDGEPDGPEPPTTPPPLHLPTGPLGAGVDHSRFSPARLVSKLGDDAEFSRYDDCRGSTAPDLTCDVWRFLDDGKTNEAFFTHGDCLLRWVEGEDHNGPRTIDVGYQASPIHQPAPNLVVELTGDPQKDLPVLLELADAGGGIDFDRGVMAALDFGTRARDQEYGEEHEGDSGGTPIPGDDLPNLRLRLKRGLCVSPSEPAESPLSSDSIALLCHFDLGSITLTLDPEAEEAMGRAVRALDRFPHAKAEIGGHTDGREPSQLARLRAMELKLKLERLFAVEPGRLEIRSYGDSRPVCQESEETCWALNRRAEVVLLRER